MKALLVGAAALAVAALLPAAAGATRPVPVTFAVSSTLATQGTATWSGTTTTLPGLTGKSGEMTQTLRFTGKGRVVHGRLVVAGASDSFVIRFNGKTAQGGSVIDGRFVLADGKGVYKGLHAVGTLHATVAGQAMTAAFVGKAHFDGAAPKGGVQNDVAGNGKAKGKSK